MDRTVDGAPGARFADKFVAYVDILGFSDMVAAAERGGPPSLDELLDLTRILGSPGRSRSCPESPSQRPDLDFQVLQISDCVVVSAEVSAQGLANLLHHCWAAVIELLNLGVACRGYVTRGAIYHAEGQVLGGAYEWAMQREKHTKIRARDSNEEGTPFVEVGSEVVAYVNASSDSCLRKMFGRWVLNEGDLCCLFPFDRLMAPVVLAGLWAPPIADQRASVRNSAQYIARVRERVLQHAPPRGTRAWQKTEQYLLALDCASGHCETATRHIEALGQILPRGTIRDLKRRE